MRPITVPNFVTLGGIGLTALYAWAFLTHRDALVLPAFIAAGATDLLDGFLARRLNQISHLGMILDPVRDRLLSLAALANLVLISPIQETIWFATAIAVLEVGTICVLASQKFSRPVHPIGRARTGTHAAAALILLASHYGYQLFGNVGWVALFALITFASLAAFVAYATSTRSAKYASPRSFART